MRIEIRKPVEAEIPKILDLMRDFAEFVSEDLTITDDVLRKASFGDGSFVELLVAADGEQLVGFAIFYPHFSSFRGQGGYFLEDIYIDKSVRGRGVGEAMLREIARMGRMRGFERIDFQVLEWNKSAIGFYKNLGAVADEAERHFRFTDDAFLRLAS